MSAPTAHDLLPLIRAAAGHAIVTGDGTPLRKIAGADVTDIAGAVAGRIWTACSQAGPDLDPMKVTRDSDIDPAALASLAGCPEMQLYGYAPAVDRLTVAIRRRLASRKAEQLGEAIATGDGVVLLGDIQSLLEDQVSPLGEDLDLSDWRTSEGAPWIVRNFCLRGAVTLLSSKGGAGKSSIVLDMIVRLAAGETGSYLGTFALPGEPVDVLLFDGENGRRRIKRRIRELVEGDSFPPGTVDLAIPHLHIRAAEDLQRGCALPRMAEVIKATSAKVVVLDPLRPFLPADLESENDNVAMGRVIDSLVAVAKSLDVAIVILNHDSKAGAPNRGASAVRDAGELIWWLTQPNDADPDYLEMKVDKPRDVVEVFKLAIRRVRGTPHDDVYPLRFEPAEPVAPQGADDTPERWKAILAAITEHYAVTTTGASIRVIAEASGLSKSSVQRDIRSMMDIGLVYQPSAKSGVYPASAKASANDDAA